MNLPNDELAEKQPSATDWFPINPLRSRRLLPVHSAGRTTRWQTDRKTENADTLERPRGLMGVKKQQTQEPAECEQLFLARSRHGNSSSLQSTAYLRAIRTSEKTRQQLRPLLFTINFLKEGLFGSTCVFFTSLNECFIHTGMDEKTETPHNIMQPNATPPQTSQVTKEL